MVFIPNEQSNWQKLQGVANNKEMQDTKVWPIVMSFDIPLRLDVYNTKATVHCTALSREAFYHVMIQQGKILYKRKQREIPWHVSITQIPLNILNVGCIQKGLNRSSYLQTDEPNYFPELQILKLSCFKRLKSCHKRTCSCSEGSNSKMEPYITRCEPLKWQNFKIQVQENNLVRLFGEMTNAPAHSE